MRVVPGVEASTHPHVATGQVGSKFGLTAPAARALIDRSERVRVRGVQAHVGSQIMDPADLAAAVEPLAALGEFPVYDLGGGLGARYTYSDQPASVADYLDALVGAARAHLSHDPEIIIEPGRSMVNAAAATLYTVTTVKRDARTFVAVDGGMGDNLEVALFGQRYEAALATRMGEAASEESVVVGRQVHAGGARRGTTCSHATSSPESSTTRGGRGLARRPAATGCFCPLGHRRSSADRREAP